MPTTANDTSGLPRDALTKWFWPVFPALTTFGVFMIGVSWPEAWAWMDVVHMNPYFADLVAVLAASDANAAGLDPYAVPAPFDPFGRPHVYGPWWLQLHHLGVSVASAPWLGLLIVILSIAAITWMLGARNHKQALVALALMASPALLLAYERANNDLIILLILVVAGLLGRKFYSYVLQAGLLSIAVLLKFYPIVALPLLAYRQSRRRACFGMAITTAITLLFLFIWSHDVHQATTLMPRPATVYGFGLSVIPRYLQSLPGLPFKLAAGSGIITGVAIIAFSTGRSKHHYLSMTQNKAGGWFIAGGLCWVGCYLLNTNHPYRAVLLLLTAASWFRLWQNETPVLARYFLNLLLALVLMLWIHYLCTLTMDMTYRPSIYAGIFGMGVMQGIALGITLVIAAALIIWGLNAFREWRGTPQPQG